MTSMASVSGGAAAAAAASTSSAPTFVVGGGRSEEDKMFDRQVRLWGPHGQLLLRTSRILCLGSSAVMSEALKSLVLPSTLSLSFSLLLLLLPPLSLSPLLNPTVRCVPLTPLSPVLASQTWADSRSWTTRA